MSEIEFQPWPKVARLNRDITITEKIDGTNAAIGVTEDGIVYAQSRTRLITPKDDNFGFARWVTNHADALRVVLGPGLHFGEWWGPGIQRGYGVIDKRFSLFRAAVYREAVESEAGQSIPLYIVPVLYEGPFSQEAIALRLEALRLHGSVAAPGFMRPEGIVIYHEAARTMFKITLEKDEAPKGIAA
jgi:hypothetical protein